MSDIQPGDRVRLVQAPTTTGVVKRVFRRAHGSLWADVRFDSHDHQVFMLRELEPVA